MSLGKREPTPAGYTVHKSSVEFGAFGEPIALLVPTRLHDELQEQREIAAKEQEREDRLAAQAAQPRSAVQRPASLGDSQSLNADVQRWKVEQELAHLPYRSSKHHPVYDPYEPVRLLERRDRTPDKEWHKRDEDLFRRLSAKGWLRRVELPKDVDQRLESLALAQPGFREVIAFVRSHLRLARRTRRPPRIPPLLLYGLPGVGKTHFAQCLAQALGTAWRRQPFDNAETASALLGSDRHWSNTRYGLLFELLALGEHANPVIVLDELDKSARSGVRYDPLGPLHSLLEPCTAAHVRDLSLDFELDASLVTWIGTANDHLLLSAPILSRFRVFHIRQAQGEDAIQTACGVINATLKRVLPRGNPVERSIAVELAHLTPREVVQAVEDAASAAAQVRRRHLLPSDLPAWALCDEGGRGSHLLH